MGSRSTFVPVRWLLIALVTWLALDMLLLWPFLGRIDWLAWGVSPLLAVLLIGGLWHATRDLEARVGIGTLLVCLAAATALLVLGGEGRLFYANTDWRVRDGVLHDMATHAWPYAYTGRGLPELLRAPIGMYLVPALAMRAGGQAVGDAALLAQNVLLLGIVFALGSTLFAGKAGRAVALAVFVAFSGLDIVGAWLSSRHDGSLVPDHLEWWAQPLQFSAHVTQLFWVPQHALGGWIGAVAFALWREARLRVGIVLMLVPLGVLWSPLAALGMLPLAALAGGVDLWMRRVRANDIALPALATLLAVPTLLYLSADMAAVGAKPAGPGLATYIAFEALEAVPLLMIAAWGVAGRRLGRTTLAGIAILLLLMPFVQVGPAADFVSRASIAPLALLALMVAQSVIGEPSRARRMLALIVLGLGAVTGAHEIARAIRWPAAPAPLCSFYGAWGPGPAADKSTYLAAVARLPRMIRPDRVTLVANDNPRQCWAGRWPVPTGI